MPAPHPFAYFSTVVDEEKGVLFSPSTDRTGPVIASELRERFTALRNGGRLLEVASGTGQHAALFAETFPELKIQPTDAISAGFSRYGQ